MGRCGGMRSTGLLLASVALAMLLASGVALAKIVEGTNHDDVLRALVRLMGSGPTAGTIGYMERTAVTGSVGALDTTAC